MNTMDNCGCGPGSGSMLSNQSDNLMSGGFSMPNNNGMNNGMNNNNTSVDLNALLNSNTGNNNNVNVNKYQMPELPNNMPIGEQSTNEILESIAKNNLIRLIDLNYF